jgi:hypothetical protein
MHCLIWPVKRGHIASAHVLANHKKQKMKRIQITLLILLIPIMSFAQVFECGNLGGGYYRVTAKSGLNLRKGPNPTSEKMVGIPFGAAVYCCNECESYPNETIEGVDGCWKKIYFKDVEGYVFSGFLEAVPKIDLMCPSDWVNEWKDAVFEKGKAYFGIYENDSTKGKSKVVKMEGKDTLIDSPTMGKVKMIKVESEDAPDFIVSNLPLNDGQQIMGIHFNNKMLFPGETVKYGKSYLYATGIPQTNKASNTPFSAIKDYRLILRQISEGGENFKETVLFELDLLPWSDIGYEGGIRLRWVGDLDNDGKLDVLLTYSTHYACWEVILLLSSKAIGNRLIGEAAKYKACGC